MARKLICPVLLIFAIAFASSCNHNKIACPTYADSFPEAKKKTTKPGEQKPELPKATKSTLSIPVGGR
jgi:hypothetical protein